MRCLVQKLNAERVTGCLPPSYSILLGLHTVPVQLCIERNTAGQLCFKAVSSSVKKGCEQRCCMPCRVLKSPSDITAANIIHRIVHNRAAYEARNAKKNKSEAAYYKGKQHVSEM